MAWRPLVIFAPLLAMLLLAAFSDLRRRQIPFALTLTIALTGLMQSFLATGTISPLQALGGLLAGFGLTFALFGLGAIGGGDVKLVSAAGAWIGPAMIFQVFLAAAIIGMVLVVGQCAVQGRLRVLLRNSLLLVINLVHIRELGVEQAEATGQSCRSVDKPLPYAVPVLIAVVAVLTCGGLIA